MDGLTHLGTQQVRGPHNGQVLRSHPIGRAVRGHFAEELEQEPADGEGTKKYRRGGGGLLSAVVVGTLKTWKPP